jgi:hypothetical protein
MPRYVVVQGAAGWWVRDTSTPTIHVGAIVTIVTPPQWWHRTQASATDHADALNRRDNAPDGNAAKI